MPEIFSHESSIETVSRRCVAPRQGRWFPRRERGTGSGGTCPPFLRVSHPNPVVLAGPLHPLRTTVCRIHPASPVDSTGSARCSGSQTLLRSMSLFDTCHERCPAPRTFGSTPLYRNITVTVTHRVPHRDLLEPEHIEMRGTRDVRGVLPHTCTFRGCRHARPIPIRS